ncbi:MAG: hypothetical protein ACYTFI_21430, partial [Planctomycetota bacterium]
MKSDGNSVRGSISRRQMLRRVGLALAAPMVVPSTVLGKESPSNRINLGMVGVGRQGRNINLRTLVHMREKKYGGVQIVAVCDVDRWRMRNAKADVDRVYKTSD